MNIIEELKLRQIDLEKQINFAKSKNYITLIEAYTVNLQRVRKMQNTFNTINSIVEKYKNINNKDVI